MTYFAKLIKQNFHYDFLYISKTISVDLCAEDRLTFEDDYVVFMTLTSESILRAEQSLRDDKANSSVPSVVVGTLILFLTHRNKHILFHKCYRCLRAECF